MKIEKNELITHKERRENDDSPVMIDSQNTVYEEWQVFIFLYNSHFSLFSSFHPFIKFLKQTN